MNVVCKTSRLVNVLSRSYNSSIVEEEINGEIKQSELSLENQETETHGVYKYLSYYVKLF